ncbi:MAG: hypothetical protein JWQ43_483 [Glaciihabitans sp.]|nr:hypothetical protein [Glaciihabitans sp.]
MNTARDSRSPARGGIPAAPIPGRLSGFIFAILTALACTTPLFCVPLGVFALIQSLRALRRAPKGTAGRGLVVAALVITVLALALTVMLMISAAVKLADQGVL